MQGKGVELSTLYVLYSSLVTGKLHVTGPSRLQVGVLVQVGDGAAVSVSLYSFCFNRVCVVVPDCTYYALDRVCAVLDIPCSVHSMYSVCTTRRVGQECIYYIE